MKEPLATYIETVLVKHDCAIVPGLGGFVVQREPARILPGRIEPPHATIGFNPLLTLTDGHIAAEHMRHSGLGYRQAADEIDVMVRNLQVRLASGEALALGRMGRLQRQPDGHLSFLPSDAAFLPDNCGLAVLYRPAAVAVLPRRTVKWQQYMRYAAACVALLLALALPGNRSTHMMVDHATFDPGMFVRNLPLAKPAPPVADTLTLSETVSGIQPSPAIDVAAEPKDFHLIVAALDHDAAVKYCTALQADGYAEAHILRHSNGLYRVALCSYASRKEAVRQMQRLRTTAARFAKAWVYCQ